MLQLRGAATTEFTPAWESLLAFLGDVAPSEYLLRELYLTYMNYNQIKVFQSLHQLTAKYLTMDHTFKVSVNVGYERADKVWVTLYDSLFCILNEEGLVLGYCFCKDRSFETIAPYLQSIYDQTDKAGGRIELISIDNCCHWRKQLNAIFGDTTGVKLDIFHAVQRITRTIPKASAFRHEFAVQLRQLFRVDGDSNLHRTKSTPGEEEMLKKMDQFESHWKESLSAENTHALGNVKKHIERGCLSRIPPGMGTNRNERLHRLLNKSALSVGHIGPELAYQLLHGIIYAWNTRKRYGYLQPLSNSQILYTGMGGLESTKLQHFRMRETNAGRTTCVAAVEGPHTDTSGRAVTRQTSEAEAVAQKVHGRMHCILHVWKQAQDIPIVQSAYSVAKFVYAAENAAGIVVEIAQQERDGTGVVHELVEGQRWVKDLVDDEKHLVDGEAYALPHDSVLCILLNEVIESLKTSVVLLSHHPTFPVLMLHSQLGTDTSFITWQKLDGKVEVLGVQISREMATTVVTNVQTASSAKCNDTVCRDGATSDIKHCRCGSGGHAKKTPSCKTLTGKYQSRCPCLKAGKRCSSHCRCHQCENPYGVVVRHNGTMARRRPRQQSQRPSTLRERSLDYLKDREPGEQLPLAPWSETDTTALQLCMSHKESSATLHDIYSNLRDICIHHQCDTLPSSKTLHHVQCKLQHIQKCICGYQGTAGNLK